MGYRPNIFYADEFDSAEKWTNGIELGKFYGYVKLSDLKSIKWLFNHNKLDEDYNDDPETIFIVDFGPAIRFTAEEFREFIDLYEEDINNCNEVHGDDKSVQYEPNLKLTDYWPHLKDYYDSPKDKIIEWG